MAPSRESSCCLHDESVSPLQLVMHVIYNQEQVPTRSACAVLKRRSRCHSPKLLRSRQRKRRPLSCRAPLLWSCWRNKSHRRKRRSQPPLSRSHRRAPLSWSRWRKKSHRAPLSRSHRRKRRSQPPLSRSHLKEGDALSLYHPW
jgi:hypothetical protein